MAVRTVTFGPRGTCDLNLLIGSSWAHGRTMDSTPRALNENRTLVPLETGCFTFPIQDLIKTVDTLICDMPRRRSFHGLIPLQRHKHAFSRSLPMCAQQIPSVLSQSSSRLLGALPLEVIGFHPHIMPAPLPHVPFLKKYFQIFRLRFLNDLLCQVSHTFSHDEG